MNAKTSIVTIVLCVIASTLIVLFLNKQPCKPCVMTRDYQIELSADSTYIYDGNRLIAVLPYDSTQTIDRVFMMDNE